MPVTKELIFGLKNYLLYGLLLDMTNHFELWFVSKVLVEGVGCSRAQRITLRVATGWLNLKVFVLWKLVQSDIDLYEKIRSTLFSFLPGNYGPSVYFFFSSSHID